MAASESTHGPEVGGALARLPVDPTFPRSPPAPAQFCNGLAFLPIPSLRRTLSTSAAAARRPFPCDVLRVTPPRGLPSLLPSLRDKLGRFHEHVRPLSERRQSHARFAHQGLEARFGGLYAKDPDQRRLAGDRVLAGGFT